jgi:hypothetical protein
MNKAHVICCNDSTEFVFFGTDEDAKLKLAQLALDDYVRRYTSSFKEYDDYRDRLHWHIRLVESNL